MKKALKLLILFTFLIFSSGTMDIDRSWTPYKVNPSATDLVDELTEFEKKILKTEKEDIKAVGEEEAFGSYSTIFFADSIAKKPKPPLNRDYSKIYKGKIITLEGSELTKIGKSDYTDAHYIEYKATSKFYIRFYISADTAKKYKNFKASDLAISKGKFIQKFDEKVLIFSGGSIIKFVPKSRGCSGYWH